MLELKIGTKPIRAYMTAAIVHFKEGGKDITIIARGRSISKAVDVAEILKRFEDPVMAVKGIQIGTEEMSNIVEGIPGAGSEGTTMRKVSTIQIVMEGTRQVVI